MPRRTNTQVTAREGGWLGRVHVNSEQVGLESLAEAVE